MMTECQRCINNTPGGCSDPSHCWAAWKERAERAEAALTPLRATSHVSWHMNSSHEWRVMRGDEVVAGPFRNKDAGVLWAIDHASEYNADFSLCLGIVPLPVLIELKESRERADKSESELAAANAFIASIITCRDACDASPLDVCFAHSVCIETCLSRAARKELGS